MALLRSSFNQFGRIITRNLRMSANLKQKAEEALEKLKADNPYYDKYAAKLAAAQQTSPEEFLSRLEKQKEKEKPKPEPSRQYTELLNPKKPSTIGIAGEIPHKPLTDIMKTDLLGDKTVDELKLIWLEYHKNKDVIAATIPTEIFEKLMVNARKFPIFIFPIPRSQGYEFIMFQFSANTIHFTPLLCYQVHKENAPECLNIVHYTEFKDKGIVFMRGEYDANVINVQEAQCLANQLQLYYTQDCPDRLNLLETFTKHPDQFKHMEVIKQLEHLQIK